MTNTSATLVSTSAAVDGGFIAVADINTAMQSAGAAEHHLLIGGVAVMLHIERLQLDLPLRVTGDADFGVVPFVLKDGRLVDAIEKMATQRPLEIVGNDQSTDEELLQSTYLFRHTPHVHEALLKSARL